MYTISYPSGTLRLNGEVIEQNDNLPGYQAYAAWLAQGNAPEVLDDSATYRPRIEITAWQLGQQLDKEGLLAMVEQAVEESNNALIKFGWRRAAVFYSDQPFTLQIGAIVGKNVVEMYDLFKAAKAII